MNEIELSKEELSEGKIFLINGVHVRISMLEVSTGGAEISISSMEDAHEIMNCAK